MTGRLMGDSITPSAIPGWVQIKCFYINGKFRAPQSVIDAWHGPKVLINVTGDPADGGDCLDVESQDASPGAIPAWYDGRQADGAKNLAVYSSRNQFDACTAALGTRRAARWLATLDGTVLDTYSRVALAAVQAFGSAQMPTNFDLSIVFDDYWHPGDSSLVKNSTLTDLALTATQIKALATQFSDLTKTF